MKFIIIDDDPYHNLLCKFVIQRAASAAEVLDFQLPEEGFAYLSRTDESSEDPVVIFLDINMPVMTGWDFLDQYALLDPAIQQRYAIYLLSSSVDWNDKERAASHPFVKNYLQKPLSKETVEKIVAGEL